MNEIIDMTTKMSSGVALCRLLSSFEDLDDKEFVINSNSSNTQTIFLDCIEKMEIYDESVLFHGKNGINDFLNLNNVLSISVIGELDG